MGRNKGESKKISDLEVNRSDGTDEFLTTIQYWDREAARKVRA